MEIRITGRRPKRSDSAPWIGENRNCISAQAVPKSPKIVGRARGVAAEEIDHELRQHRNDDADRQHVEQHGDEDEDEGRLRRGARRTSRRQLVAALLAQRRFRPA